jgi:sulfur-oxidizing protein SoxX
MIESSFTSKGPATVEGVLNQDATQKACSQYPDRSKVPAAVAKKVEAAELKQVKYPADNSWIGDWKEGEKIAQNGRGMQFTDAVGGTNGGNCYACHQLTKAEISFGNIGPSLYQYGKLRGNSAGSGSLHVGQDLGFERVQRLFQHAALRPQGILTEQQIRDVMALLLDPASPVNQQGAHDAGSARRGRMDARAGRGVWRGSAVGSGRGSRRRDPPARREAARRPHHLPSQWAGKPLVVEIWASWCPFCALQNPRLQALYDKTRGTPLRC